MKYLKHIGILSLTSILLILSIKSGYAEEETYDIMSAQTTTTQTLDIEIGGLAQVNGKKITSDLALYKDITVKKAEIDSVNAKKVTLTLMDSLTEDRLYSILAIIGVQGSIEFHTDSELIGKTIKNTALEDDLQGIQKIVITGENSVDLYFLQNVEKNLLEFKFYDNLSVTSLGYDNEKNTVKVLMKDVFSEDASYVISTTYFQGEKTSKINIKDGVYEFTSANSLKKYTAPSSHNDDIENTVTDDTSLEDSLLEALGETDDSEMRDTSDLLDEEIEIKNELNSASEDPDNTMSQLEKFALGANETPDAGAETWILILLTYIINTYYYVYRRKKDKITA